MPDAASVDLTTDYLIAGSGAVGMAFADTLLSDTDADIIIVDLHQPSAYYGVESMELSRGLTDRFGWKVGLGDLATGADQARPEEQTR